LLGVAGGERQIGHESTGRADDALLKGGAARLAGKISLSIWHSAPPALE